MIYVKLTRLDGVVLADTFPDGFIFPKKADLSTDKHRYKRVSTETSVLEVYVLGEKRIVRNRKAFKQFFTTLRLTLENSVRQFEEYNKESVRVQARKMTDDHLHNLIKIHGNQTSIIERCISGAEGCIKYEDFVRGVREGLLSRPDDFAEDVCSLFREVRLMEYHMSGYALLHGPSERVNITKNHSVQKILLGLAHLFFNSFKKNNVFLDLYGIDREFECSLEYETFNIAMHCFLENTAKYVKPYTKVELFSESENNSLVVSMVSIRIEKEELLTIRERGKYGAHVPEDLRGEGIGMFLVDQALKRSEIELTIKPDFSQQSELDGVPYTRNIFRFNFAQ